MKDRTVGVIGASGQIGRHLCNALIARGWRVIAFSRSVREDGDVVWRKWAGEEEIDLEGLTSVINLSGEAIDQRWTKKRKALFRTSRVHLTAKLSKAIVNSNVEVLLNASATGIYGDRGDEGLPESASAGTSYLAELCRDWENAVEVPENVRTVFLRTGVVLGKDSRAWGKMSKIFKWGIGGKLGNGRQWMPWIHLYDEVEGIVFCLENEIEGPVNLVAPESVRNAQFTKAVGKAIKRVTPFAAPAFGLKLLLGDFAKEGLLASARVNCC
ncbi:MAG: TIGR01777 family oxidoreductase [Akkermansiaceae bacterium]